MESILIAGANPIAPQLKQVGSTPGEICGLGPYSEALAVAQLDNEDFPALQLKRSPLSRGLEPAPIGLTDAGAIHLSYRSYI